jgi:hypothetical protein
MWTRIVAKLLALTGLYALVLAGIGMKFSGQRNSGTYSLNLVELAVVTLVFLVVAVFMVRRRPRRPLE